MFRSRKYVLLGVLVLLYGGLVGWTYLYSVKINKTITPGVSDSVISDTRLLRGKVLFGGNMDAEKPYCKKAYYLISGAQSTVLLLDSKSVSADTLPDAFFSKYKYSEIEVSGIYKEQFGTCTNNCECAFPFLIVDGNTVRVINE